MTLNDLEQRSGRYFALLRYYAKCVSFKANYVNLAEARSILSTTNI